MLKLIIIYRFSGNVSYPELKKKYWKH